MGYSACGSGLEYTIVKCAPHECRKLELWLFRVPGPDAVSSYYAHGYYVYEFCLTKEERTDMLVYLNRVWNEVDIGEDGTVYGQAAGSKTT